MKKTKSCHQEGFVLAAVIMILAAISIGAGLFSIWANRMVNEAWRNQYNLQIEVDCFSTRNTLLYLFGTGKFDSGGLLPPPGMTDTLPSLGIEASTAENTRKTLPVIALDDRLYQGHGGVLFSIQDEAGLLGVNFFDRRKLDSLLGMMDIPASERGPLIAKLLDYQDVNNLVRLNGAEEREYAEKGLTGPANRLLLSSWELRKVLDWNKAESLWKNHLLPRQTTVASTGIININSATPMILQTIPGVDGTAVQRITRFRKRLPLRNIEDFSLLVGKGLKYDDFELIFMPSPKQRLTIWHPEDNKIRELHVEITPSGKNGAPWIIDYEIIVPLPPDISIKKQEVSDSEISIFKKSVFPENS